MKIDGVLLHQILVNYRVEKDLPTSELGKIYPVLPNLSLCLAVHDGIREGIKHWQNVHTKVREVAEGLE